jgi:hypothetical protein
MLSLNLEFTLYTLWQLITFSGCMRCLWLPDQIREQKAQFSQNRVGVDESGADHI